MSNNAKMWHFTITAQQTTACTPSENEVDVF